MCLAKYRVFVAVLGSLNLNNGIFTESFSGTFKLCSVQCPIQRVALKLKFNLY